MSNRTPVIGGNWKMNTSLATGSAIAEAIAGAAGSGCEVVVFPPFPYLLAIREALHHGSVRLGAQNVYPEPNGAFTGEISTAMLHDVGVQVALVGHSERRHVLGEDDATVNKKVLAALEAHLDVVLCVGETLEQREAGETDAVNRRQLTAGLAGVSAEAMARVVIAYEPVWAIGTGRTASPDDAQKAHAAIRSCLEAAYDPAIAAATRIQYGGSVKPANAAELIAASDIDGFLVGGASLDADDFLAIIASTHAPTPAG